MSSSVITREEVACSAHDQLAHLGVSLADRHGRSAAYLIGLLAVYAPEDCFESHARAFLAAPAPASAVPADADGFIGPAVADAYDQSTDLFVGLLHYSHDAHASVRLATVRCPYAGTRTVPIGRLDSADDHTSASRFWAYINR